MTIEAGAVVCLKSGGMAMTVVSTDDESAECVWCGEEGELFREKIPTVALIVAEEEKDEDEEDEDREDNGDEDEDHEDGEDDDDHRSSSKKKKAA